MLQEPDHPLRPGAARHARRLAIAEAADEHGGVLSRALLRSLGADRHVIRHAVASGRWRLLGDQTVVVHTGPVSETGDRWRAVWETGLRIAALDGATALQQAGMTGFTTDSIHVSIPHGSDPGLIHGVQLHRVIRRVPGEVVPSGLPRTRPAVAAIRAAHWAVSNRQAALVLAMPVQQRIVTPSQLREAAFAVRGRTRRAFIRQVVADVVDGAHSLGELDFARMCRLAGCRSRVARSSGVVCAAGSTSMPGGRTSAWPSRSTGPATGRDSPSPMTCCGRTRSPSAASSSSG